MLDEKKFYLDLIVKEAKDKYPNAIDYRGYFSKGLGCQVICHTGRIE